jgi:hypothetical protein
MRLSPLAALRRDREQSHCWHNSLVTVRDEARLRQGHNNQSRRGHQCSETTWALNPGPS